MIKKWMPMGAVLAVLAAPLQAEAKLDKNLGVIFRTAAIGVVGGTLIGLATWPFSQNIRTVFMGSSVGLYVGAVAGVYFNAHRDDARLLLEHTPQARSPYVDLRQVVFVHVQVPVLKF